MLKNVTGEHVCYKLHVARQVKGGLVSAVCSTGDPGLHEVEPSKEQNCHSASFIITSENICGSLQPQ